MIKPLFIGLVLLTAVAGCTTATSRDGNGTRIGNIADTTELQRKINEVRAGDFGEFVVELHQAGTQFDRAQEIYKNVKSGNSQDVTQGYAAANQAIVHRNNAQGALTRVVTPLVPTTSNTEGVEQRLDFLEALHVKKDATIPSSNVYFDFNGHRVNPTEKAKITQLIDFLRENPLFALKLVGYADTVGSVQYNLKLAERRNQAVVEALRKQGLPTNTVITVAVGKADGPNETKNPENRRVEVKPYVHGSYMYSKNKSQ